MMMTADSQKNAERINIVYRSGAGVDSRDIELPFRVLVVGAFTDRLSDYDTEYPISVSSLNLDDVIKSLNIVLNLSVPNRLLDVQNEPITIEMPIESMHDFTPDGIVRKVPEIQDILEIHKLLQFLRDTRAGNDAAISFIHDMANKERIVASLSRSGIELDFLDETSGEVPASVLAELDRRIGEQLDEIIHAHDFMRLESSWRSLKFLLDSNLYNENCLIELLSVSKEALTSDFEDVPEITHSRFYDIVYSSEFGQFGGRPYGVIVGDYEFAPDPRDMKLAQQLATVSSMAHAPFISGAHCSMFDIDNISDITRIRDFSSIYEQTKFAKWNAFRQTDEARYFALTIPRFRLRAAYGLDNDSNNTVSYQESTAGGNMHGLWGNSAYAFATRLIDSFSKYRWCINITGVEDGKVDKISMETFEGAVISSKIPTQVLISDRQNREISSHGFMPLSMHKGSNIAAFFASNSVIAKKTFANDAKGKEASLSHHLGSQLQYLFITCRIAHYLKMMQREHMGAWKNKSDIERELNDWVRQYVSDMDNPTSTIRAKRPLRRARIVVEDVKSQQDWYLIEILLTPHLKYMGSSFTLDETGKLDKH